MTTTGSDIRSNVAIVGGVVYINNIEYHCQGANKVPSREGAGECQGTAVRFLNREAGTSS